MSHLLQMRGLKPRLHLRFCIFAYVASFTDAWIETDGRVYGEDWTESHLLQMRGLKLHQVTGDLIIERSHLLQMRGLKRAMKNSMQDKVSRIFYRCVD